MAEQRKEYQRVSRPYLGLNGTASLWVGSDHLIQVTNRFGWERYRRWFYRDIQALVARRTATRLIWNVVVGFSGIFIAMAAGFVASSWSGAPGDRVGTLTMAALLGVVAILFLAVAAVNTLLGATCQVYLQTPNGMEKLSGPVRIKVYERLVEKLRPATDQAQAAPASSGLEEIAVELEQRQNP